MFRLALAIFILTGGITSRDALAAEGSVVDPSANISLSQRKPHHGKPSFERGSRARLPVDRNRRPLTKTEQERPMPALPGSDQNDEEEEESRDMQEVPHRGLGLGFGTP